MIGIIGIGQIGDALLSGLLNEENIAQEYAVFDINKATVKKYKDHKSISVKESNIEVVKTCDVVFLCIKPIHFHDLTIEIKPHLNDEQLLVSLAPDFSLSSLQEMFSHKKVIRMMPSTLIRVRRGVIALSKTSDINEVERSKFDVLMQDMGYLYWTDEVGINQTIGVAGSGIAFAFQFIEALGQGGISNGLNAEDAYRMAAETLIGAGEMMLKTTEHPAKLRDQVCTPGGLTIQGITKLEEHGFKRAVIEAVKVTYQKEQ